MKRRMVTLGVLAFAAFASLLSRRQVPVAAARRKHHPDRRHHEAPEVNLTSRIAGRITQLDLLEGDRVQRDQVVCRIEDVDVRNQLAKAQGDLQSALADLKNAELTVTRNRELYRREVISAQARDDSVARVEQSRAAVIFDRASVQLYSDQLADTVIKSPITGIVVNKSARSRGVGDAGYADSDHR